MNMLGFVYRWKNKVNGKKYIGLHLGLEDDSYTGSGVFFKRAIQKYGLENFEREILYREYESEEKLYQKEFDLINEYNAVVSVEYYNQQNFDPKFVKFQNGRRTRIVTEEIRKKQSILAKARAGTEHQRKIDEKRRGKKQNVSTEERAERAKRIRDMPNPTAGRKCYTNGKDDKFCIVGEQPENWFLGRSKGKRFGKENSFFGRQHTTNTKEIISNAKKNKMMGDDNPSKREEVRLMISLATRGKKKVRKLR